MLEAVLTGVAVILALTQPVPQVVRLVRSGSIAGVSGPTSWLGLAINAGWLAYGVGRDLLPVAVLSSAYVAGYLVIGVLLLRGGNRRGPGIATAASGALALLTVVGGWALLGTVLALTVGVQFLPQVREAWTAGDLSGLAPGTYVVCLLDGLVWGTYGVVALDGPLMLYGAVMTAVAVLVLVPQRRWARSSTPPPPAPAPAPAVG